MTDLAGKNILVVGATGALGSRLARRLADAGATLVLTGTDSSRLAQLDVPGRRLVVDLTDGPDAAATLAAESLGGLDGVVVAAGVVAFGPAGALDPATVARLFAVNAAGPIALIAAALPLLAESATEAREPFVVTISGVVAESPTAGLAAYSASKAALAAFMAAASREMRRSGIRLLDARPGHIETGLATRAIAGTAPAFPTGLDPDAVADRIVAAIEGDEKDLPSTAF
ncbi:cyclic-di-GMP-binding biofilm dispersal mediator protein [Conyzicola lurida]|uniref:Cyclic-di-GMP-binding biofilm dispersal mediator protein n=1 Tax=Conyzicola lurida TaxID=1172621 RepID=A0A841AJP1_9MICO|nr:SDR family NAD(P)-dependent oxidoreductase [Conyzicola lurida]MBB5842548.1 cyclic-di-GMP-binding biofilm dispersal mediator protein [Conyzicola lurida]